MENGLINLISSCQGCSKKKRVPCGYVVDIVQVWRELQRRVNFKISSTFKLVAIWLFLWSNFMFLAPIFKDLAKLSTCTYGGLQTTASKRRLMYVQCTTK